MPTTQVLTIIQTNALLDHLRRPDARKANWPFCVRNYTMAVLMLDAGLRVGELVQLRQSHLIIQRSPVKALTVTGDIAKRHVERIIPLTVRAQDAIAQLQKFTWRMFANCDEYFAFYRYSPRSHLVPRQVERIIKYAALATFSQEITPHTLRHTFATRILQKSNLRVTQQLLGHARVSTTQRYTHPNSDDLTNAIGALND